MRRTLGLAAVAAGLALLLPLATVSATPPAGVTFVVDTQIPPEGPTFGPFVATGPAVDAGVMCPTGDTIDVFGRAAGFQSGRGINILVFKLFTCHDGSGAFLVKLQVRIDARGNSFTWTVMDGADAYATLHGTGSGFGAYPSDVLVIDTYEGGVHLD